MSVLPVYVETGVSMASDDGAAAWVFEPQWWGRCGQGENEASAVAALLDELQPREVEVVERVHGDEQVFSRDLVAATATERARTVEILAGARLETVQLVASCSERMLDFDDRTRLLPSFARWRTIRQLVWHIVDTESRYYLPSLGLAAREAETDLAAELASSADHVRRMVATMPADLVRRDAGEVWTTTKVLRRLAWHERSELRTLRRLVDLARAGPPD